MTSNQKFGVWCRYPLKRGIYIYTKNNTGSDLDSKYTAIYSNLHQRNFFLFAGLGLDFERCDSQKRHIEQGEKILSIGVQ